MSNSITTGDGCRIAYRFDGAGAAPVLLLSNSLGTAMSMWDPQIEAFSKHFNVLRYDSRGHGQSDSPAGAYSMDRLGRDVVELIERLDLGPVYFCGLSLGGMVGQWLGVREPALLRGLVLANSSAYMGPPSNWDARIALVRAEGMGPLADASIARWFTRDFPALHPDVIAPIREALLATKPEGYAGCCAAIRDMDMRQIGSLNEVPTLIIGGTQDPATPPADSEALGRSLYDTQLTLLNAAHLSNIEQPDEFAQAVLSFIMAKAA